MSPAKKCPGTLPTNAAQVSPFQAFNEAAHIHYLLIEGKWVRVPGVSTISKVLEWDAADRLMGWAVKQQAQYLAENLQVHEGKPILLSDGAVIEFSPANLAALIKAAKARPKETQAAAGDLGTRVHGLIEAFLKTNIMPAVVQKDEQPAWAAWMEWYEMHLPKVFASELHVGSIRNEFAGILDIGAIMGDDKYILDIKTTREIYPSHLCQVGGYALAYEEQTGEKINFGVILRLDKTTGIPEALDLSAGMGHAKGLFLDCRRIYRDRKFLNEIINQGGRE